MTAAISTPIPTNIITGFLGSGKTTLIQHLLAQKPQQERWAVLVNEFGEIGIDGQLLSGDQATQEVFIREVPGGCMCCTSGLPMQIALNQLITKARPHRLLIEPTGLGHPKEVLAELSAAHNKEYLDLKTVITLIDARKLVQPKYHQHKIYAEQLEVADLIVANKMDLYQQDDIETMNGMLEKLNLADRPIEMTTNGELSGEWLEQPAGSHSGLPHLHSHGHSSGETVPQWQTDLARQGFASTSNTKGDFYTEGWIFNSDYIFDFDSIYDFLNVVSAERIKGVFITDKGIYGFNKVDDVLSCAELDESDDSRVEFIFASGDNAQQQPEDIHAVLMNSVRTRIA